MAMKRILIAGMIGNALEWYDYALYAQFASMITLHFFPASNTMSVFLTFLVFAVGFIARPLGGILFGIIGDEFGRRIALAIGITAMAVPTACIGLIPSYATIGIAAPILLTIIRLMQGFAVGGEFSGCISYLVEHASLKHRGLVGSVAFASLCIGMLVGTFVADAFNFWMPQAKLIAWGWRLPFIASLFVGGIGLYIRLRLSESPLYIAAKASGSLSKYPVRETFKKYWPQLLVAFTLYVALTAPFYIVVVYLRSFMQQLGYTLTQSSIMGSVILLTLTLVLPISAAISDKLGRRFVLITGLILLIIACYPAFASLATMNYTLVLIAQIIFAAILAFYMGPVPTVLVELFPTKVRFTAIGVSYNLGAALFGGTAPMVAILLAKYTGNNYAVAFYLMILALLALFTLRFYQETYKKNLAVQPE